MKDFIEKLKENKIDILLKNDNLEVVSYEEKISEHLLKEIKENKSSIIQFLKENTSSNALTANEGSIDYKTSYAQKEIWAVCQDPAASVVYHLSEHLLIENRLSVDSLKRSIEFLINRYEILRTTFKLDVSGELKQIIHHRIAVDVNEIDYTERTYEDALQFINEDTRKGFDLEHGPLIRFFLIYLPGERCVFGYNIHHIILDEWSSKIFENELFITYDSFVNGKTPVLENLHFQYRDYIDWHHNQLNEPNEFQRHKDYWTGLLLPLPEAIELPTSKIRPSFKTYDSVIAEMFLSIKETALVVDLIQKMQGSLFMGTITALKILLYRYTGHEDIIIGSPMAIREREEFKSQIGYFLKTLILRNTVFTKDSFSSLFSRIKKNLIPAYEHSVYPISEILKDIDFKKDQSKSAIFDITVTFHEANKNVHFTQEIYPDLIEEKEGAGCKNDIEFHFGLTNEQLYIRVNYNKNIYSSEIINKFIEQYKTVLLKLVQSPDLPVDQLDYLGKEEKNLLLEDFNATKVIYPEDETIISLFEKQVYNTPDVAAVVFDDIDLSYKVLNSQATALAYELQTNFGIQKGDQVGVMLSRSEKQIVAILGVLKAGAVYVPIDASLPDKRKEVMSEELQLLITESFFFFDLDFYSGVSLAIDVDLAEESIEDFTSVDMDGDDIAYIIYTSGSTGEPKGVLNTHSGILNTMLSQIQIFEVNHYNRIGQFASFSFDASISEIFMALLSGKCLYILNDEVRKDPNAFEEYIADHEIDIMTLPPAFFSLLNTERLKPLKAIITAGEDAVLGKTKEYLQYGTFYNAYGPTETSICATVYKIDKGQRIDSNKIPIGKPIANTRIYILDANKQMVPIGVAGELYIAGAGLAQGYLNLPELTGERFVDNPFEAGTKMYRTGDLGHWLSDGNIEYLGRTDHQVKVRGHRIELGEIDSQVLAYSSSIKTVVTEVKDYEGDKSLVVYYVSESPVDKLELSKYLGSKLPQYMLPGFYVELNSIPLTGNGKIDRNKLPEVSHSDLIKNEYVEPQSPEEKILVGICEQVLKHSPISIRDNYYNLGGDSIKSIQIVSRLRQQGYFLKVEHILQYPVLEELARYITTDVAKIDQSVVTGESILTPIQRYFFESEEIANKNHYNQSVILKSRERLSGSVLKASVKRLVDHHDALRMVYSRETGVWSQYNEGTGEVHYHIDYFDIKDSAGESEELSLLQKIGEELQSSIDIESGILFHVGHVSMRDGDRIILVIHHLVVDGVSWRILLEDLGKLYESGIQGLSTDLPSKTDSFQTWGKFLDDYSRSSVLSGERLYWENIESENYPALTTDYPVKGKHILENRHGFSLSAESTKLLQTLAGRKYSAEINDVLLTGLALSLQEQFGVNKTKILLEGHGREPMDTGLDISRTVGWFTSVYPISLDISDAGQPAMVSVKEGLRSIPNKGIGYGILNYLDKPFTSSSSAFIQFNYLGDFNEIGGSEEGKTLLFEYSSENIGSPVDPSNLFTSLLLDISGMTVNGMMNIGIRYSAEVFKKETIEKLLSAYQTHLEEMIKRSEDLSVIPTPSDLTYKHLSFNTILEISKDCEIEDIYGLSPMQQGLYYHWLANPKGYAYFVQTSYKVNSAHLDVSLVEQAFGILLNRYTILRTSFENRYGEVPLQIVHKQARLDFRHIIIESELELDNIRQGDINRGFNLNEATQMRLLVVELPDGHYEFIWSHHHITMDGWCLSILINDFSTILGSLQQGVALSMPDTEKYSSYIRWLESIDKEEALTYWENYLKGIDCPISIPFVKTDAESCSGYLTETFSIGDHNFEGIKKFCQDLGITLNTYVQGVWSYLLGSYNSSEEVVFGCVVSGRPTEIPGIENMVGLFINTIPVCARIGVEETPRSLLNQIHQGSIQSSRYHFNSLAEIQSLSSLGKELINHIVVFENYVRNEKESGKAVPETDLSSETVGSFEQTNYPFALMVIPNNESLHLEFRYDSSVFSSSSIAAMVSHFKKVFYQFVAASDTPLKTIDYLSDEEKAVLDSFNSTEVSYSTDETVISLFGKQVLETPDHIAVKDFKIDLTYQDIDRKSDLIARYLVSSLGEKKEPIGVLLDRSAELIVILLGILKSGKSYIPIDARLPEERVEYIISQSGISCIITENTLLKTNYSKIGLDRHNQRPIHLIFKDDLLDFESFQAVESDRSFGPDSKDTAYIIYTSGSTGNPKGVEISHQALTNFLISIKNKQDFQSHDILYSITTYSFDISILEFFAPLISGAGVFIASKEKLDNMALLKEEFEYINPTIIQATPSFYQMLFDAGWKGNKNLKILCGGENLNKSLAEKLLMNSKVLWNMYGPTETTVWSSAKKIEKPSDVSNIGTPINNTQIYIVDKNLNRVPKNVIGRIFIGGDGLAKGYYKNQELTRKKFISNPFLSTKSAEIYETGDLGRWNEDGEIEFFGRNDFQVKIRGLRIELGEIETNILKYPFIKQAVCEAKEVNGEKTLIAFYTANNKIDKAKLREYLSAVLPEYMIPSFFLELNSMPLNTSGKVNRNELPTVTEGDLAKKMYLAPRTPSEKVLVKVCEEVFKYAPIGVLDNYYNLGGNSIKSIQIVSKLYQHGYTLKIEHFLNYPILEKLSMFIAENVVNQYHSGENVLQRDAVPFLNNHSKDWNYGDTVALSPNQYFSFRNPYSSVNFTIETNRFDENNFENKLRQAISKASCLSIKYETDEHRIMQRYISGDEMVIKFQTESLQFKSEEEVRAIGQEFIFQPYDLFHGELIRVFIVKKGTSGAVLFFGVHHSLLDDYSANGLKGDLEAYFNSDKDISVKPHYFKFINDQQSFLRSEEGRELIKNQVKEILKTPLYDHHQSEEDFIYYQEFSIQEKWISGEDYVSLQEACRKMSLSLNAFCLSLFLRIINDHHDESRRFYAIMSNNRENPEYDDVFGVLTNLIVSPYSDFIAYSKGEILNNYVNMMESRNRHNIPYEIIREEIKTTENKDLESNIIGIYNYLNENAHSKEYADWNEYHKIITEFDGISLKAFEHANGVLVHLVYPITFRKINFSKYINEFMDFLKAQ